MDLPDDVVRAAARGDAQAFQQVYDALAGSVLGYLQARGVEDPEGVTSEVFLAVLPRMPDLHGGAGGLRTLVFSVAHARAVDDARRRARRPHQLSFEPEHDRRWAESAEQTVVGSLEAQRAVGMMAHLPDDQRTAVTLRFVGDLSLEQTAEVMDRSVGSVKQLQRRGLLRLRALLDSERVAP